MHYQYYQSSCDFLHNDHDQKYHTMLVLVDLDNPVLLDHSS